MSRLYNLAVFALLISGIWFLAAPSPIHAQNRNCNTTPQYKGPFYHILFDDPADDCSEFGEDTKNWEDFIDYSVVTCVDKPELIGDFVANNKDLLEKADREGNGAASLGIKTVGNLAADSSALDSNFQAVMKYLPALTLANQAESSWFVAACRQLGIQDNDACASHFGTTIGGTARSNTLQNSTPRQRLTSLKSQVEKEFNQKRENVLRCTASDSAPDGELCNNIVEVESGVTTKDDAIKYDSITTLEEYLKLGPQEKQEVMSMPDSKASMPFYLVVVPAFATTEENQASGLIRFFNWLAYQIREPPTYIIRGTVPAAPNVLEDAKTRFLKYTPATFGESYWNQFVDIFYNPVDHSLTPDDQIRQKIDQSGKTCDNVVIPPGQFMGGTTPSRTQESINFTWFFSIISDTVKQSLSNPMIVWRAYLIQPKELPLLDLATAKADYAIARKFFPLNGANFNQEVVIPQPLEGDQPKASTNVRTVVSDTVRPTSCNPLNIYDCDCPSGYQLNVETLLCDQTEDIFIAYEAAKPLEARLDGGLKTEIDDRFLKHGRNQTVKSNERLDASCYYPPIKTALSLVGLNIATLMKVPDVFSNYSNCPTNANQSTAACTIEPEGGACGICNTGGGLLAEVGYPTVPDSLMGVFESAGREFNVPASIIMGVMFSEGGFQRDSCYGKWTEESVAAATCSGGEINQCHECNVSSQGALGPFQIIATQAIPGSMSGANPCNFYDAARIAAYNLSMERDGRPEYAGQTCGPYTLTATGHRPASCSDWTDQDIINAVRTWGGVCNPQQIKHVLEFWHSYSCQ